MFAAKKLKRPPTSLWKSILHAWMSVRSGLCKSEPTNSTKTLRQPVFGNPLIVNQEGRPLGLYGRNEGNSLANAGCSRVRDFWNSEEKVWKGFSDLGVSFHPSNKRNRDLIIASIPWDPATSNNVPLAGEWISKKKPDKPAHRNGSTRSWGQPKAPPTCQSSGESPTRAASEPPAPTPSPYPWKDTNLSGCSLRIAPHNLQTGKGPSPPKFETPSLLDPRTRLHLRPPMGPGSVAPLLCPSVGVKPNTWKSWDLESSGTPECSELNSKGQNTLHWGVLSVVEKVFKRKYRKFPRIGNSNICSPSYGQKKGRESNWQFDSRPLKVGNRCLPGVKFGSATRR
jgi:hypothetical protein